MPSRRARADARDASPIQGERSFARAAPAALADSVLRRNLGHATSTIRAKRAAVVGEVPDWEALRDAGSAIKAETLARLPELLEQLEAQVTSAGGTVHWARDAAEANQIVTDLVRATGEQEVVKVKSMATQEIGLNEHLQANGIAAHETDLAELIVQLGDDRPSHILVPAIHLSRTEIREVFARHMPGVDPDLTSEPRELAMAARSYLRELFLHAKVGISGANFAIAETGTLSVVESEGNGRMCLTLPETLITVMGIEKVLPRWSDLGVFLQLLPRSSTGERMNPYTTLWTGTTAYTDGVDGPREFHLVLLDNGRTDVLADEVGRAALHCIRCSACLNVCPVYERTGGHSYGSVYPGPIGAILSPQLTGLTGDSVNDSLPYASSLCGACYDVCPVKIDIPSILVDLRARHIEAAAASRPHLPGAEAVAMAAAAYVMRDERRFAAATSAMRLGRPLVKDGHLRGPLSSVMTGWSRARDVPTPPEQTFRAWWAQRERGTADG
ncbi:MAG: LutB/LldF family L-lactate oxidation iron-sulfur protein [Ornithinimicrobium sp.]|uniref:LutB/LldF family L-lactate oxidation iron-sulfur protein n=1 Tax=Ornithinimicrobium sp. TaxID=1977084 RepID=UPI003D9BB83A